MTRIGVPVPPGLHRHHRGVQRLPRGGREVPARPLGGGAAALTRLEQQTGKKFGDPEEPAAGLLPLRRQVLDARHDGHRAQHRHERRRRRGHGEAHRRRALCLRQLPPPDADVRLGGDGHRRRAVRGGPDRGAQARAASRTTPICRRGLEARHRRVQGRLRGADRRATSPRTRSSSSASPPRRCSSPGTASAPSTTATPPRSPHDLGTAVNICTMVFGNMGNDSGTGVAMTRSGPPART